MMLIYIHIYKNFTGSYYRNIKQCILSTVKLKNELYSYEKIGHSLTHTYKLRYREERTKYKDIEKERI